MGGKATRVLTAFQPAVHGFSFANCFPRGKPVWTLPTPFGRIPIGDAANGLCGGMVFAALDYVRHGRPIPQNADADGLHSYLARRLWHSFHFPRGVARIYRWMGRSDSVPHGSFPTATVPFLTAQREWPLVRASLDRGEPAPLMLIQTASRNPWDMGLNHQVLATGYSENADTGEVVVAVYDPNYPIRGADDAEVTLRFHTVETNLGRVLHSRDGETVRGFFLNGYSPERPPNLGG